MSVDTKESVTEIGDMEDNKTKVKDGGSSDAVMEGKQEDKISSYEKDEGEQKVATELSDPSDTFKLTEDREKSKTSPTSSDVKDQVIQVRNIEENCFHIKDLSVIFFKLQISGLQGQQERSDQVEQMNEDLLSTNKTDVIEKSEKEFIQIEANTEVKASDIKETPITLTVEEEKQNANEADNDKQDVIDDAFKTEKSEGEIIPGTEQVNDSETKETGLNESTIEIIASKISRKESIKEVISTTDIAETSVEATRVNETIEGSLEKTQKEAGPHSYLEQEICIEKEELESNEKFSKAILTTNEIIEGTKKPETTDQTPDKVSVDATETEEKEKADKTVPLIATETEKKLEAVKTDSVGTKETEMMEQDDKTVPVIATETETKLEAVKTDSVDTKETEKMEQDDKTVTVVATETETKEEVVKTESVDMKETEKMEQDDKTAKETVEKEEIDKTDSVDAEDKKEETDRTNTVSVVATETETKEEAGKTDSVNLKVTKETDETEKRVNVVSEVTMKEETDKTDPVVAAEIKGETGETDSVDAKEKKDEADKTVPVVETEMETTETKTKDRNDQALEIVTSIDIKTEKITTEAANGNAVQMVEITENRQEDEKIIPEQEKDKFTQESNLKDNIKDVIPSTKREVEMKESANDTVTTAETPESNIAHSGKVEESIERHTSPVKEEASPMEKFSELDKSSTKKDSEGESENQVQETQQNVDFAKGTELEVVKEVVDTQNVETLVEALEVVSDENNKPIPDREDKEPQEYFSVEKDEFASKDTESNLQKGEKMENQAENTTQQIEPSKSISEQSTETVQEPKIESPAEVSTSDISVALTTLEDHSIIETEHLAEKLTSSTDEKDYEVISPMEHVEMSRETGVTPTTSKQLDEIEGKPIKQLEETSHLEECEIVSEEVEVKDKSASEDRSEMMALPSTGEIHHTARPEDVNSEVTESIHPGKLEEKSNQHAEVFEETSNKQKNEVGKETIDDVKSSSECGVKGLKDYLEETVEDETSNEAGEEISAKLSDSDAVIESDITKEDQKKESKGFISSIIGTVGGYFYGSNKKDEDSNEKISESEHIPREFQMQPTSETSTELASKQPIDFKDESEIIVEESEEQTKGKESPEPVLEDRMMLDQVLGKVEAAQTGFDDNIASNNESIGHEDLPVEEEPVEKDIPEKLEAISETEQPLQKEIIPDKKDPVQKDISEKEHLPKDLPGKQEPVHGGEEYVEKDIPDKQEALQRDLPEKGEPIPEPVLKDIPDEQEPLEKDLPAKQEPMPVREECVEKDITDEQDLQKDLPDKQEPVPGRESVEKDIPDEKEPAQHDVPEEQDLIQKDILDKKEFVQKDIPNEQEPPLITEKQEPVNNYSPDGQKQAQKEIPEKEEDLQREDEDSKEVEINLNNSENLRSQELKIKIVSGSEGIKMIISNLLSLLEELSQSVSCQQSIVCMKNELVHYEKESAKIMDDAETDCLSEEKAVKITESLTTVVVDVKNYISESKELSEESQSSSISSQEFDKLLSDCQDLLTSLETFMKDSTTHTASSPEEFLSAKDVLSASTSFNDRKDEEELESIDEETEKDKSDGSSEKVDLVEKMSPKTETEGETKTRTVDIEKKITKLQLYFIQIILITNFLSNLAGST